MKREDFVAADQAGDQIHAPRRPRPVPPLEHPVVGGERHGVSLGARDPDARLTAQVLTAQVHSPRLVRVLVSGTERYPELTFRVAPECVSVAGVGENRAVTVGCRDRDDSDPFQRTTDAPRRRNEAVLGCRRRDAIGRRSRLAPMRRLGTVITLLATYEVPEAPVPAHTPGEHAAAPRGHERVVLPRGDGDCAK